MTSEFDDSVTFPETSGFDPINGVVIGELTKYEWTINKRGDRMVKGIFGITEEPYNHRQVWVNFNINPDSMWVVESFLVAAGVDPDKLKGQTVQLNPLLEESLGVPVLLVCVPGDEYKGQIPTNVKKFMAADDRPATTDDIPF